jgi:SAM-dependent methyltransferase
MDVRAILSRPRIFDLWSYLVGADRCVAIFVREHVRPYAGARILDVGCGTGRIVDHLPPESDYLGIDIDANYIARASAQHREGIDFRVGDAAHLAGGQGAFDVLIACGVLHHLDDGQAHGLFRDATRVLDGAGRIVTIDPVFAPGQSRLARGFMSRDRGKHIRTTDGYVGLAKEYFPATRHSVHRRLLRVPYWHCVLECSNQPASDSRTDSRSAGVPDQVDGRTG